MENKQEVERGGFEGNFTGKKQEPRVSCWGSQFLVEDAMYIFVGA